MVCKQLILFHKIKEFSAIIIFQFTKSRIGGSRNGCEQCSVKLKSDIDTTLIFESRFESGNLGKAIQV